MKFRPLHDRVVVRRIEAEEKSAWRRRPPLPSRLPDSAIAITKIKPATARRRRRPRLAPHPARRASSPRGRASRAREYDQ
jgi:hypothetical protein